MHVVWGPLSSGVGATRGLTPSAIHLLNVPETKSLRCSQVFLLVPAGDQAYLKSNWRASISCLVLLPRRNILHYANNVLVE